MTHTMINTNDRNVENLGQSSSNNSYRNQRTSHSRTFRVSNCIDVFESDRCFLQGLIQNCHDPFLATGIIKCYDQLLVEKKCSVAMKSGQFLQKRCIFASNLSERFRWESAYGVKKTFMCDKWSFCKSFRYNERICQFNNEFVIIPAWWCLAVSRGMKPSPGGVM